VLISTIAVCYFIDFRDSADQAELSGDGAFRCLPGFPRAGMLYVAIGLLARR